MGLKRSGYATSTPKHYLIDAGAVYKNLVYDKTAGEWTGDLLGATSGGNKLAITNEYRQVEVDGVFTTPVGSDLLMKSTAVLEINAKEFTAENLKLAINGASRDATTDEAPAGYKIVEGKSKVEVSDYINNLGLVGTLSGSDEPVIVILNHAFCTSGLNFETTDDTEATIPMTFESRSDAGEVEDRKLPVRIFYPPVA